MEQVNQTHETTEIEGVHKCICGSSFEDLQDAQRHISGEAIETDSDSSKYYRRHSGEKWEEVRKKVKKRDNYRCKDCGITDKEHREDDSLFGKGLHIHHIIPVKEFQDPKKAHTMENLMSLCADCHSRREK